MARAIDADRLADGLKLHRQPTDQKHEADRQWAVGYNAGLDRALHSIAYAPTLTQPDEPLTLEELREMDGEPVWVEEVEHWALIDIKKGGQWDGTPFAVWKENWAEFTYNIKYRKLHCYRRPPEGEEK